MLTFETIRRAADLVATAATIIVAVKHACDTLAEEGPAAALAEIIERTTAARTGE